MPQGQAQAQHTGAEHWDRKRMSPYIQRHRQHQGSPQLFKEPSIARLTPPQNASVMSCCKHAVPPVSYRLHCAGGRINPCFHSHSFDAI